MEEDFKPRTVGPSGQDSGTPPYEQPRKIAHGLVGRFLPRPGSDGRRPPAHLTRPEVTRAISRSPRPTGTRSDCRLARARSLLAYPRTGIFLESRNPARLGIVIPRRHGACTLRRSCAVLLIGFADELKRPWASATFCRALDRQATAYQGPRGGGSLASWQFPHPLPTSTGLGEGPVADVDLSRRGRLTIMKAP